MRPYWTSWVVIVIALTNTGSLVNAQGPTPIRASETALEQFEVAGDGDVLLLPVTFAGKNYHFLLDTGSAVTVFDRSLPLGKPKQLVRAETVNGDAAVELFDAPNASLGKLNLRSGNFVLATDLEKIRQVTGHEVRGVIGMDFLKQHIVRIDFDSGKVTFCRSVGPDPGRPVPLDYDRHGAYVEVKALGLERPEKFLVDTGSSGFGRIQSRLVESLAKEGNSSKVGETLTSTVAGTTRHGKWRVNGLSLGGSDCGNVVFTESQNNLLGLGCWSRYAVTFDFPKGTIYLKESKRPESSADLDMSGMRVLRIRGETVVHSVEENSPAARIGIKAKDALVKIADKNANEMSMFTLRRLLCSEGREIPITIKRGNETLDVKMTLGRHPEQKASGSATNPE